MVIGASFIGLETAAALRTRKLDVHVAAPEKRPLEKVFGAELGDFVRSLHEEKGVVFHLENAVTAIEPNKVSSRAGRPSMRISSSWASACARARSLQSMRA